MPKHFFRQIYVEICRQNFLGGYIFFAENVLRRMQEKFPLPYFEKKLIYYVLQNCRIKIPTQETSEIISSYELFFSL